MNRLSARERNRITGNLELGGSAWVAACTSFLLFAAGAIVPVLPFVLTGGRMALLLSVVFSTAALFVVGAGIPSSPAGRCGSRERGRCSSDWWPRRSPSASAGRWVCRSADALAFRAAVVMM